MVHANNSREFQQFLQCYSITHQTSSPNHPRSNGFVERIVGVAKKLMDKAGKEGKPWISGLFNYRLTPVRQHCITIAIDDTAHSQGKEPTSTSQCTWCPRNPPNPPGTHQEAREQARKKLHQIGPRYTSLGSAQAECYMGTSNIGKPMFAKLLVDHAGESCRATKSVQVHQNNVENKIYPPNERVVNRNKKHQV